MRQRERSRLGLIKASSALNSCAFHPFCLYSTTLVSIRAMLSFPRTASVPHVHLDFPSALVQFDVLAIQQLYVRRRGGIVKDTLRGESGKRGLLLPLPSPHSSSRCGGVHCTGVLHRAPFKRHPVEHTSAMPFKWHPVEFVSYPYGAMTSSHTFSPHSSRCSTHQQAVGIIPL